ncbi:hypothetical protein RMSM_03706 [Rhodopirellula maiorica SM1]|uniref:Uncharacterized protein n=1 Tax=Rhodopirellula maiorica SM1 TaxID=1265738 RepID=M5RJA4_9BACT|nr:hypothetical protein [Rhodopirellula maiorica]EMI19370.1 hypothetical protein RMSM_03706 [Rhodopirellula maiorica SM1]
MNLASRIALIAYVVGGWLLPAMHHHPGHSHAFDGGPASSMCCSDHGCEAALPTLDSPQNDVSQSGEASSCCHNHGDNVAAASDADPAQAHSPFQGDESNAILYAVDSGDPHACIGLCALCAAQSLIGQTDTHSVSSVGENTLVGRIGSTGIGWPLRVQRGGISSRGPPAIL